VSELLKDRAVFLRTFDFGESSVIVVALTRSSGKIRLIAKGAKRMKSRFAGSLQTGALGDIVYYHRESRGLQLLKEISGREGFDTSRGDLERLCIFQAGLEIADRSIVEREAGNEAFDAVERFIGMLRGGADPWMAYFALEVRLLDVMGHLPRADVCASCKKMLAREQARINPSSGQSLCGSCGGGEGSPLSAEANALFARMGEPDFDESATGAVRTEVRKELGTLLHLLFVHHVDGYRLPKSLELLRGGE
jgi:DNA repair protein RecO (recombination protein O)